VRVSLPVFNPAIRFTSLNVRGLGEYLVPGFGKSANSEDPL